MIISIFVTSTSTAAPSPTPSPDPCLEIIKAADKALEDKDKQIEVRDTQIKGEQELLVKAQTDRDAAKKSSNAWYKNTFLTVGTGVAAGALLPLGPVGPIIIGVAFLFGYLFTPKG